MNTRLAMWHPYRNIQELGKEEVMVDNSNPTNQFHPYQPADATPHTEARSGVSGMLEKIGIDSNAIDSVRDSLRNVDARQAVDKIRGAAQRNPAAVLGGIAALAIGAGLLRKRMM